MEEKEGLSQRAGGYYILDEIDNIPLVHIQKIKERISHAEAQRRRGEMTIDEWVNNCSMEAKSGDHAHGIICRERTDSGDIIIFVSEDYARKYISKNIVGSITALVPTELFNHPAVKEKADQLCLQEVQNLEFPKKEIIEPIKDEPKQKTKHGKFKKRNKEWHRSIKLF